MNNSTKLRIAIHKNGTLNEKSKKLLKECGINFDSKIDILRAESELDDIEILSFRQEDIPNFVSEGIVDAGIIGQEVFAEAGKSAKLLDITLGISKCKLSVLVPNDSELNSITDLENKRIATSYPYILKRKLAENYINAQVFEISQDTIKVSIFMGLADAIFDKITEETSILLGNVKQISFSEEEFDTVFIYHNNLSPIKKNTLERLNIKLKSILDAKINKYIVLNAPQDAVQNIMNILPAMQSPTVVKLHKPNWVAIHTVIEEKDFWEKIEFIKSAGAEDIIVMPVEKLLL